MISSEVQRTLVKSPPELWTELSDPASLARHLGEFGEIRITRVEPETTVEWEADSATGSVSIKPSGWGTRVILKATREISDASSPTAPEAPAESNGPAKGDSAAAIDQPPAPMTDLPPEPATAPEPEIAAEPEITPESELDPTIKAEQESPPDAQAELEDTEQPAAEAAPGLADWSEQAREHQPQQECQPEPEPEPHPRRGFLARVFGWRRRQTAAEPRQLMFEDDPDRQPDGDVPIAGVPAPLVWAASGNELQAPDVWPPGLGETDPAADALEAPAAEQLGALEPQAPEPQEQMAPQPEMPAPAGAEADPEDRRQERLQPDDTPEPVADISAELGASGETAEREVAAVLSAMLDRLGTAHHRPFSRG